MELFQQWTTRQWISLAAMAAVLVFFAVYFVFYLRAIRPRAGTLDWILGYDKPAFCLAGGSHYVGAADVLPVLLVVVLTAMSWRIQVGNLYYPQGLQMLSVSQLLPVVLNYLVLPALSSGILYVFIKTMWGNSGIAFLSGMILGLDMTWQPSVTFFILLTTYFTCRHVTLEADCSWVESFGSLLLALSFFSGSLLL